MDRRLAVLAVAAAAAVLAAAREPALAWSAGLLVPVVALAGALGGGLRSWGLAVLPAAVAVVLVGAGLVGGGATGAGGGEAALGDPGLVGGASAGLGGALAFAAVILAGPIAAALIRRGHAPGFALAVGALPWAMWAAGLALTGFDPLGPEAETAMAELLAESAGRGDIPAERLAEVRSATAIALTVLRQTWVASEAVGGWLTLALAWIVGRAAWRGRRFGRLGRFAHFDVPDEVVAALIAGLALTLIPGEGVAVPLATVGWNLVAATGFVWAVRGVAIEWYWMERGNWRKSWRIAFLAGGVLVFLPAFLLATLGLGLFDTWFDFRRVRKAEEGGSPFSFHRSSSGDDVSRKD